MKKITLAFLLLGALTSRAQVSLDSLKETIDSHSMKFEGLDERLSTFLTCGHLVHVKCISEYFLSPSSEGRCPICRHQEKPRM